MAWRREQPDTDSDSYRLVSPSSDDGGQSTDDQEPGPQHFRRRFRQSHYEDMASYFEGKANRRLELLRGHEKGKAGT